MFKSIDTYVDALVRALSDGALSDIEFAELRRIALNSKLSEGDLARAQKRAATIYAEHYSRDGLLDSAEEAHLKAVMTLLGLTLADLGSNVANAVTLGRQMNSIASGNLPVVPREHLPVAVSPREVVHLVADCSIYEDRVVSRRTVGGSAGVRVRIFRGVSVGVGGFRGTSVPVSRTLEVSRGYLLLTSFGARYMGSAKGFQKSWSKISGVDPCNDGVVFYFSDRNNPTVLQYNDARVAPYVEAICLALLQ